jgi:hypothetical protein
MSQQVADKVKGRCKVAAVSNAWRLAPWADILVSHDARWWRHNRAAFEFSGRKLVGNSAVEGLERFRHKDMPLSRIGLERVGCNSGLMAMIAAREAGATKICLLGVDMHGTHFFGPHPKGLRNTDEGRRQVHLAQYATFRGCEVINCTPGSALKAFPFGRIEELLCA